MSLLEIKIIALLLCIGSLVGYHFVALHNAVKEQEEADKQNFSSQVIKINAAAKADHDSMQQKIDDQATEKNAALQQQMAVIQTKISSIGKIYAPTKALPVDCVLDDQRLHMAAQALSD